MTQLLFTKQADEPLFMGKIDIFKNRLWGVGKIHSI